MAELVRGGASTPVLAVLSLTMFLSVSLGMNAIEKSQLKEESRQMFYHAYHAYMANAYPADELMPLSCKGRYRDVEPSRGDVDDSLGNFSLTLIDSLDTLVILGDLNEFEKAVRLLIKDVSFDSDVVVSVFETNIRVLGGLLSGHILASFVQEKLDRMGWYRGELLSMAKDVGYRLLPAFNTTTGVPHPRINLRYGLKSPKLGNTRETCTACAGTMILELAALSRLTGESIFEDKAHRAMDYLWQQRHRSSDLMGTVLNIYNGDWIRRDSGVGAGIDSYYEYCLKAYILLGYDTYLERFNKHYSAVMKYVSQGPLLVDVHMHRPHTNSRNFMDSLLAFWPGLQVLKGDIKPAIETHEMLYQVMQRHNFLPEAFTMDFQVHWGQHPLRPEFLESTYFLYKATGDSYYLDVGKNVLTSLQKYARVPCGFAAVKDVRTGSHEDRMDSFVLAETFKYLFLLFAEKEDLIIDVDDFLFTTEAHLLPLSLARLSNYSYPGAEGPYRNLHDLEEDFDRSCPNANYLFPGNKDFAHSIRQPLKNLVEGVCPKQQSSIQRRLRASDFQAGNEDHMKLLRKMGITIMALPDGRVQLLHTAAQAETTKDAEEGMLFMQEMIELSKSHGLQPERNPRLVSFNRPSGETITLNAGPAQFGTDLKDSLKVSGQVTVVDPLRCCRSINNAVSVRGKIGIVQRGDCMFVDKARQLQNAGAIGGIVMDNSPGTSSDSAPMFAMSGDGRSDVHIPMVFLFSQDASTLMDALTEDPQLLVTLAEGTEKHVADETTTSSETTEHLVPASSRGEAREVDPDVLTPKAETIYIRMGENGQLHAETLRKIVRSDGTTTMVKVVEQIHETHSTKTKESSEMEADHDPSLPTDSESGSKENAGSASPAERQQDYLSTLKKLMETAMGNQREMDPNTKKLLNLLSELMRPKTSLDPIIANQQGGELGSTTDSTNLGKEMEQEIDIERLWKVALEDKARADAELAREDAEEEQTTANSDSKSNASGNNHQRQPSTDQSKDEL